MTSKRVKATWTARLWEPRSGSDGRATSGGVKVRVDGEGISLVFSFDSNWQCDATEIIATDGKPVTVIRIRQLRIDEARALAMTSASRNISTYVAGFSDQEKSRRARLDTSAALLKKIGRSDSIAGRQIARQRKSGSGAAELSDARDGAKQLPGRPKTPDSEIAEIASVYAEECERSINGANGRTSARLNCSKSKITARVHDARRLEYLTPTVQGSGGGVLTEKGRAALSG